MYDRLSHSEQGWSWEKIGIFGGEDGQVFLDGTFKGSDKHRSLISLIVENGIG